MLDIPLTLTKDVGDMRNDLVVIEHVFFATNSIPRYRHLCQVEASLGMRFILLHTQN